MSVNCNGMELTDISVYLAEDELFCCVSAPSHIDEMMQFVVLYLLSVASDGHEEYECS